ncbi:protein of unknown function [Nitrospina watsonii]|uniref:Uncharacterized protein n=1 Tax=Nitrospina watsonii TaxID=1323948 RepID=A0ABN8VZH9_9BACT|nr:protein of unknown function [Nitrospina watsonii]
MTDMEGIIKEMGEEANPVFPATLLLQGMPQGVGVRPAASLPSKAAAPLSPSFNFSISYDLPCRWWPR